MTITPQLTLATLWLCVAALHGVQAQADTLAWQTPLVSAHRGGRQLPNYPENALETFQYTFNLSPDTWIECDVSMSRDSVLFLLHDYTLERTTTGQGAVRELPWAGVIDTCHLVDDFGRLTNYRIPRFEQVLAWAKAQGVVLTVDVKRGVSFPKVVESIQAYGLTEQLVVITYNAEDAALVHRLEPRLKLSVTVRNETELQRHLDAGIPPHRMVAFTGVSLADKSWFERLHSLGIPAIVGVLGNLDKSAEARGPVVYWECLEAGANILATDRPAAAWLAIEQYRRLRQN